MAFDGPRCQQLRHSFSGNGWAWYEPLKQCQDDAIILEISTQQTVNSLVLYNGPFNSADGQTPDFISLELISGYPRLRISLGVGDLSLIIDGRNSNGVTTLSPLFDGAWHTIEIIKKGMVRTFQQQVLLPSKFT